MSSRSRNCHFLHWRENYNRQQDTLQATLTVRLLQSHRTVKYCKPFQPHPPNVYKSSWEFEVQVPSPQQMAVKMTGLLAYLKRVLWRFFFLLIVRGKNRTVKNSELSFIAYRFQPHPLACTKCSWVFEVLVRSLQQTYLLIVGLLACLQRVLRRFISLFVGCGADFKLGWPEWWKSDLFFYPWRHDVSYPQGMNNEMAVCMNICLVRAYLFSGNYRKRKFAALPLPHIIGNSNPNKFKFKFKFYLKSLR